MIEVALFGAGRIGTIHAGNIARQPGVRLKYVVDVDAAAAAEARADARRASRRMPTRVFDDAAIAAVAIGSSTDTHADLILRAAKAGKAIFCEKPVDLDLRARARARRPCGRAGVTCLIGFQRRYDPTFAAVKARIARGDIGRPGDADRHEPRSRRAARRLHQALRRHLQGHADPRFRRVPLDHGRRGGHRVRDGKLPDRSGDRGGGRRRRDGGDDPHARRPACADQHDPPRRVWLRPAVRGARQQGHAAGRQSPADGGGAVVGGCRRCGQARIFLSRAVSGGVRGRDGAFLRRRRGSRRCAPRSTTA